MVGATSVRRRVRPFALGRQFVTPGARAELSGESILSCFSRHAKGDFGDVCASTFDANIDAIANDERIVSMYQCRNTAGDLVKVLVITAANRDATTLSLEREF